MLLSNAQKIAYDMLNIIPMATAIMPQFVYDFIILVLLVLLVWMLMHDDDCFPQSFGSASVTLCNGLAAVAYCLCVDDVDSAELMAFVACRLVPLDKKPGAGSTYRSW